MREGDAVTYCCVCGGEIYALDRVWFDGGSLIHEDCIHDWVSENLEFYECAADFTGRGAV